jgi:hypothetical protein
VQVISGTSGRDPKEIDDQYSVLERLAKPSIVGGVRVISHEGVVDRFVAFENLPMHLALVVIPNLAALLRQNGFDRQKEAHLLRFEDAALRIDERDALTVKHEARLQLGRGQVIVDRRRCSKAAMRIRVSGVSAIIGATGHPLVRPRGVIF